MYVFRVQKLAKIEKKGMSEVGFEPTPSIEDQNSLRRSIRQVSTLESGALDRSAILTCQFANCSI